MTEIEQHTWDRFATGGCSNPFLLHDWLRCLERSGCASESAGWTPRHIVLRRAGEIVCIAPAYVKTHSLGEFVFDQEWAEAAYGAGILYYPKLLLAVPFTPAAGRRLLTEKGVEGEQRDTILNAMAQALVQICHMIEVSSVHVNFCTEDEVAALSKVGFLERKGVQYHFTNYRKGASGRDGDEIPKTDRVAYRDFEDYLSEFRSKKRIKMRRERKVVREESGLNIDVVTGADITHDVLVQMFQIYKSTIDKMFFGRQYLKEEFFKMLSECDAFKENICLVLARCQHDGRIIGGTFNVVGGGDGGAFFGRYWGCIEEYRYLHFEACYYASIEYCIQHGLSRMEPGAGGGDFKYMRGFEPSITYSMHYLKDKRLSGAVSRYLQLERDHVKGVVSQMQQDSAIRAKSNN